MPLPPPPQSPKAAKMHNLGIMPSAMNISPSLPAPTMPTNRVLHKTHIPIQREPKSKQYALPKQPKNIATPSKPMQFPKPSIPTNSEPKSEAKTHNLATMP